MSMFLYDTALLYKLKTWTNKVDMHIYGPNDTKKLFEITSDIGKDTNIKLPIIVLKHNGGYTLNNSNKTVLTYDGLHLSEDESNPMSLNAIPITIPYQIDVYTRYMEEADAYMRDILFNVINHPTFRITIPYNGVDLEHVANIRLSSQDVQDNSDIPEAIISGSFSRLTISINVDDAYLWSVPKFTSIGVDGIQINLGWTDADTITETIQI